MTTFYIIRHGETISNIEKKLQGQQESPLTELGKQQAKDKAIEFENIHIDYAFSSDLSRSKQTAELVLNYRIPVETSKLLRERAFGRFEAKPISFFLSELDQKLTQKDNSPHKQRMNFVLEKDMETDNEIASRMIRFIQNTADKHPNKIILIASHGGIVACTMIKLGLFTYQNMHYGSFGNLGYAVVQTDGKNFELKKTEGVKLL